MYIGSLFKIYDNAPQYVKDFVLVIQDCIKESGNDTKFKITLPLYFPHEKEPLILYGNRVKISNKSDECNKILNDNDIIIKLSDNGAVLKHLREKNVDINSKYKEIFNNIISGFKLEKEAITAIFRFSKQSENDDLQYENMGAVRKLITEDEKNIFKFEEYLGVLHKVYNLQVIIDLINDIKGEKI